MAPDLTPEQKRRVRVTYAFMGVLGALAMAAAFFEPFGRYTAVYVILAWAAIAIPLHLVAVAVSIRRSKRKGDEARRAREQSAS